MAELTWYDAVDLIKPHVVRISTPRGIGTGYLISNARNTTLCAIATAAHVVDQAHHWEEPIRIQHADSGESLLVRSSDRALFLDVDHDTAAIIITRATLPFPTDPLELTPQGRFLRVGNEIGWLGFPAVSASNLCFFGGRVSACLESEHAYLVDGVAINGVSGGPAFFLGHDLPVIMGVVSAYVPNRATGESLPGLSVVRNVNQFHELAPTFASLDQAKSEETPPTEAPPPAALDPSGETPTRRAI